MSVRVHSSLLYEDLVGDSPDPSAPVDTGDSRPASRPSTERRNRRNQRQLDLYKTQTTKMLAEQERKSKENLAKTKSRREAAYNSMIRKLDNESTFLEKIDEFLALKEHTDRRRQQRLYKEWHKHVFAVIQAQVEKQLSAVPTADIEARRRALFDEYLKAANRKEGLFRDIITSDYDPFANTRRPGDDDSKSIQSGDGPVLYNTGTIRDPLKQDIVRVEQERLMIGGHKRSASGGVTSSPAASVSAANAILKPHVRAGLDILLWNKLESTPHGRYAKMFADAADRRDGHHVARPLEAVRLANTRSTLVLDHYNVTSDPKVSKAEFFPKGKKCTVTSDARTTDILHENKTLTAAPNVARARRLNAAAQRAAAARSRVLPAVNSSSAEQKPVHSVAHDSFIPPRDQKPPPAIPKLGGGQLTSHIRAGHVKVLTYAEQMHEAAEQVAIPKRAGAGGGRKKAKDLGITSTITNMTYAAPEPVAAPPPPPPVVVPQPEPKKGGRKPAPSPAAKS